MNKSTIMVLSTLVFVSGQIFAAAGITASNKTGHKIKVTIDKGKPVEIDTFEAKFIPTSGYGKRAIRWEIKDNVYETPAYNWPDIITIKGAGEYELQEKFGLIITRHSGKATLIYDKSKDK